MAYQTIIRDVKYPAIDGIRFYAAFSVLVMHLIGSLANEYLMLTQTQYSYQATTWAGRLLFYVSDGNHGVDVFFIISGFLMARIVLDGRKKFSYAGFIGSRIMRIYPAFLLSLILTAAAACLLFGWEWSASQFALNLVFLNAWPGLVRLPYNHVSWSLGFEFAFYLVIPAILLGARFFDRRVVALVLVLATAVCLPADFVRMVGLFIGAMIGAFDDRRLEQFAKRAPLWPLMVAYVGCGIAKAVISPSYSFYYFTFIGIAAMTFVKVVWDSSNVVNRFFRSKAMRWLGTLSFSLYLFHPLTGSVALHLLTPKPATWYWVVSYFIVASVLTLMTAYASYVFAEQWYFTRRKKRAADLRPATTGSLS